MTNIARAPKPDDIIYALSFAVVDYKDIPLALEIVTTEGRRIGVPIEKAALFGLFGSLKDAVEVLSKSGARPTG